MKGWIVAVLCCAAAVLCSGEQSEYAVRKSFVLRQQQDSTYEEFLSCWCGWCRKHYKDVLSTPEFINFADEKMFLFYLDRPHRKSMPAFQKLYNLEVSTFVRRLARGGVPSACIFNSRGWFIGTASRYSALPKYMQPLQKTMNETRNTFFENAPSQDSGHYQTTTNPNLFKERFYHG